MTSAEAASAEHITAVFPAAGRASAAAVRQAELLPEAPAGLSEDHGGSEAAAAEAAEEAEASAAVLPEAAEPDAGGDNFPDEFKNANCMVYILMRR